MIKLNLHVFTPYNFLLCNMTQTLRYNFDEYEFRLSTSKFSTLISRGLTGIWYSASHSLLNSADGFPLWGKLEDLYMHGYFHSLDIMEFISGVKYTFCLRLEMKGHGSRVNIVKRDFAPLKNRKINVNFSVTWPVAFIGKCLPKFSYASLQANAMGV